MTKTAHYSLPATQEERQLMARIGGLYRLIDEAYSAMCYLNGEHAIDAVEGEVCGMEYKIEVLAQRLEQVRERRALFDRHATALKSVTFRKKA